MLPRQNRLNTFDLKELKLAGKRVHSTLFSITWAESRQNINKYGLSVTKKLYKKAVDRNRAKRRVFSIIRELNNKKNGHFSLFLKANIDNLPYLDLKKEIEGILCQK